MIFAARPLPDNGLAAWAVVYQLLSVPATGRTLAKTTAEFSSLPTRCSAVTLNVTVTFSNPIAPNIRTLRGFLVTYNVTRHLQLYGGYGFFSAGDFFATTGRHSHFMYAAGPVHLLSGSSQ